MTASRSCARSSLKCFVERSTQLASALQPRGSAPFDWWWAAGAEAG